jgi:NAD+ kinase
MTVYICINQSKPQAVALLPEIRRRLDTLGIAVADCPQDCDIILTVGGDGTILHHGKTAAELKKPLLGINTGKLGFMANLEPEPEELGKLSRLTAGEYRISRRMLAQVSFPDGAGGETSLLAVNDAVFSRMDGHALPEFTVSTSTPDNCRDENIICRLHADGMIFSTPTGATAYALSAGGAIIEPELNLLELTPICAHTLFSRAIIISADTPAYITCDSEVHLCVDGGALIQLHRGERVKVERSPLTLDIIDLETNSFFDSLNNKLTKPMK